MNASPGKYIVRVIASNNDGVWNNKGVVLEIIIHPPWWRTWVAYICYLLIAIGLVTGLIKLREKSLLMERNHLERKVKERTEEIELQKNKIELAHQQIQDSINYASRIQTSMLPGREAFTSLFADCFIVYKPRDVVSGDFLWLKQIGNLAVFAVADCTGHGVPGAMVSMLGISLMNDLVTSPQIQTTGEMLNILRDKIKLSFNQQTSQTDAQTKDGMDIALCAIDFKTNAMQFSGANNPIYIVRMKDNDKQFFELKATKNPIGNYVAEKAFETINFNLESGDILYLFTDGYSDQFNGTTKEKFKQYRFKKIILDNAHKPLEEQKIILEQNFEDWKNTHYQVDDILIVGLKIL